MSRHVVTAEAAGMRLDRFLATRLPDIARAQLHRWILDGRVRVDASSRKPAYRVRAGNAVEVVPPDPRPLTLRPEPMALDILYEDAELIVMNKPAGMVVHPGAGQTTGTLVHALLAHCRDLAGIGDVLRPGIVHRLDKGTSGVMVVAKTHGAHRRLVEQFQDRTVEKHYLAMVMGGLQPTGRISAPIGRHPTDRKRMSTVTRRGRAASTEWRLIEDFDRVASWIEIRLLTGRTHQIRVHFASRGNPLCGDVTYGGTRAANRLPTGWGAIFAALSRPALHAWRLRIRHPTTAQWLQFEAPIPMDLQLLLRRCRERAAQTETA